MKAIQQHTIVNTGFLNISDSSLFNNVPDKESLNCLILSTDELNIRSNFQTNLASENESTRDGTNLGAAFPAVGTPNGVHMTTVVLVPATVSTLESLHK